MQFWKYHAKLRLVETLQPLFRARMIDDRVWIDVARQKLAFAAAPGRPTGRHVRAYLCH